MNVLTSYRQINNSHKTEEKTKINNTLIMNGYTTEMSKILQIPKNTNKEERDNNEKEKKVVLPYIKVMTARIKNIFERNNIKALFTTTKKLDTY